MIAEQERMRIEQQDNIRQEELAQQAEKARIVEFNRAQQAIYEEGVRAEREKKQL